MLLLALVVFAVTAWFLGLRPGGIAAVFSFAALIVVMAAALSTLDPALVWARLDPRP